MTTKTKPSTTDSLIQMLQEQIQTNQKQSLIIDGLTQEIKLLREQIAYLTNKMITASKMYHLCNNFYQARQRNVPVSAK